MASDGDDGEWTYSIEEVGEDAGDGDEGDERRRIEPESMNPENVAFVVLGVLIAIGTIAYGLGII
ncbi:hypothetical protein [Halalkalicoccus sp. NIPERK01]|uniref:DUF7312 domain-containing protein n=1 Tax=Halalkalicoccus sp. NIPERK01 TaxID=3053469 RepID=UPI00256F5B46|nr:hypothetical protein [Halalkalicoccus sp. NIPERK01]MDL5361741.1 hypothetical protein [Halalkalicoccus sp. NIPERK01]